MVEKMTTLFHTTQHPEITTTHIPLNVLANTTGTVLQTEYYTPITTQTSTAQTSTTQTPVTISQQAKMSDEFILGMSVNYIVQGENRIKKHKKCLNNDSKII